MISKFSQRLFITLYIWIVLNNEVVEKKNGVYVFSSACGKMMEYIKCSVIDIITNVFVCFQCIFLYLQVINDK